MKATWSDRLRNSQIQITGNTAKRFVKEEGTWVCALTNHPVSILKRWTFHIKRHKSWSFVGICHQDAAACSNFIDSDWNHIGHGHYAIAENGFVYSYYEPEQNDKMTKFKFEEGDILKFHYDPSSNILQITQKSGESMSFKIDPNIKQQEYYPCVYLHEKDDQIQFQN